MPPVHLDALIYLDAPYVWTLPMCLDTPYMFRCPHMFGCSHMFRCPHMFGCPHMVGHPWYVWMPSIYLNVPHTSVCLHAALYICMFLGGICIWYGDGGIYTPHIECSDAITRIIYKKHYKFIHVGKHKYLNKTPYDLYELFIYLFEGAKEGYEFFCLSDEQTDNSYK